MKNLWSVVVLISAVSAAQAAEVPATRAVPAMDAKTAADLASYAIGLQIANKFKADGADINVDQIILGLKDAMQGAKPRYSDGQLQAAMEAFGRRIQAKIEQRNSADGEKNKREGQAFLAANGRKAGVKTLESGLQYQVIKAGQGPSPKATDTVRVHYEGTFPDGKVFDSSLRTGQPATFRVDGVIPGWTEALQRMHVGEKWRIVVPSNLAYGARGAGNVIGPHAVLIFEVELLGIE